jgi:hypothetical protein
MSDVEPFPELIEEQRLDPGRINGVDQARLTIGADGATVTFRDEVAEFQDTLGVYLIDQDGTIRDPKVVFARIEHADPLPGLPHVRPGGGPLAPGDDVALSDLYPNTDLEPGQQFGLFIVANGAERNPSLVFDGSGRLEFVNTATGGPTNIADDAGEIELRHIADDGSVLAVRGPVFHTADADPNPLDNNLNPGGEERVVSGLDATSGALLLGFEDQLDFDFNDVVIDLGPPGVVRPPIVTPPASLADLDGTNGFRLDGIDTGDLSGYSVAGGGDVNGDGFADLIIGAPYVTFTLDDSSAGKSYVVFGKAAGFAARLDLADLDGTNGFRLDGIEAGDRSGISVAGAGDVNGDGSADLIVAAPTAGGVRYGENYNAGESYVVFGRAGGFAPSLDLADLDGTNGFRLDGIDAYDAAGVSISTAGDVNGDGFGDLVVGAPGADPGGTSGAGESYVVFGKPGGFAPSLKLAALDGTNGFRLDGIDEGNVSGASVSTAGDVNGDGFDDLIIGARYVRVTPYDLGTGESYVVFGKSSGFAPSLELAALDGTNGFRLKGIDLDDRSGVSVSTAGDVNGDGFDDWVIGAVFADPGGVDAAGESYVVFGKSGGFAPSLDLADLDGTNGFRLDGIDEGDLSGWSVSRAGDVNGDGFDDIVIGAQDTDSEVGESYIVFGKSGGFAPSLDLADLDGANGFRLDGIDEGDHSSFSVAGAGDVDGDGFADLIIGAPFADTGGDESAGESYVVFGGNFTGAVSQLGGPGDDTLTGTPGDDVMLGAQGDDTLLGNGGIDVLNGGAGGDLITLLDPAFLEGFGTGGARMLGGTGVDTLRLDGTGDNLDLTAIPEPRLKNIEQIDLGGDGNQLTLDVLEILNLDDASNTLTVLGDDTNAVSGSLPGAMAGSASVGGLDFTTFTVGEAELLVLSGIDTSGIDTSAV